MLLQLLTVLPETEDVDDLMKQPTASLLKLIETYLHDNEPRRKTNATRLPKSRSREYLHVVEDGKGQALLVSSHEDTGFLKYDPTRQLLRELRAMFRYLLDIIVLGTGRADNSVEAVRAHRAAALNGAKTKGVLARLEELDDDVRYSSLLLRTSI